MKLFVRSLSLLVSTYLVTFSTVTFSKPLVTDYPMVENGRTVGGQIRSLDLTDLKKGQLKDWNLSEVDYQKYQKLMQGEAGIYFSHLEPINVLGIYATNDADRQRYAKILVERDNKRVDNLLSFNRAYVKQRLLTSDGQPFDESLIKEYRSLISVLKQNISPELAKFQNYKKVLNSAVSVKKRYTIVIKRDCPECDSAVKELILNKIPTDITIVNSDSAQISNWAVSIGINRSMIQSGAISLNRDDAKVFANQTKFPVIYESGVAQ